VPVRYNNGASAGTASFAVTSSSAITGLNAPISVSASSTGGGSIGIPGNPVVNTAAGSAPFGNMSLAQDAAGNVWAGVSGTTISEMLQAGHTFAGGATTTLTTGTGVQAMATAANGIICLIAAGTNEIGCFDPSTASAVEYTAALASLPVDISQGPDGDIWVAEAGGSLAHISASVTPALLGEYDVSGAIASPTHLTSGPDGNLWMIEQSTNTVATFNPTTLSAAAVTPSGATLASPNLIVAGSDGNMWVAESGVPAAGQSTMVKIVPGTGAATPYVVPGVVITTMITGPDGNLWAGDSSANQMAAISPGNGKLLKAFKLGANVDVTSQQLLTNTSDQSVYVGGLDTTGPTSNLYYFTP
jgi:streptogramin lyase